MRTDNPKYTVLLARYDSLARHLCGAFYSTRITPTAWEQLGKATRDRWRRVAEAAVKDDSSFSHEQKQTGRRRVSPR